MRQILARVNRDGERWLLLVFYALIVATIAIEVLRRFGLAYSSVWGEEIARYAFIYLVWIGASAAVSDRAHIRIDVLFHYLPPKGKAVLYIFGDLVMLAVALIAFYFSLETLLTSVKFGSVTHGLRIEQAWFLAAVPFGFTLITLRLIASIWRDVSYWREGKPVFEGHRLFD